MGLFTKDIKTMEDLFLHTLEDVYYAENQIVKSLPKMIDKATNRKLAWALPCVWVLSSTNGNLPTPAVENSI